MTTKNSPATAKRDVKRVAKAMTARRQAEVFAALGDPIRVRFLRELGGEELTGTQMAERLGVSLSLLCHHAKVLVTAGVVRKRKEAQTTYYSVERGPIEESLRAL